MMGNLRGPLHNAATEQRRIAITAALATALLAVALLVAGFRTDEDQRRLRKALLGVGVGAVAATILAGWAAVRYSNRANRAKAAFAQFRAGGHLVVWSYPRGFAQDYAQGRAEYARKLSRLCLYVAIGFGVGGLAIGVVGSLASGQGTRIIPAAAAIAFSGTVLLWAIMHALIAWPIARQSRLLMAADPQAIIARNACYFAGQCMTWDGQHWRLKSATIKEGAPPMLEMVIEREITALDGILAVVGFLTGGFEPSTEDAMCIPLSPDLLASARSVAEMLNPAQTTHEHSVAG